MEELSLNEHTDKLHISSTVNSGVQVDFFKTEKHSTKPQHYFGASPSGCLVLHLVHSLGESYPSAEMQSEYFTATANWASK